MKASATLDGKGLLASQREAPPGPLAGFAELAPERSGAAAAYLRSLRAGASRDSMRRKLRRLAWLATGGRIDDPELLPWARVTYPLALELGATLAERYEPATARTMQAALRGVWREAFALGEMTAEEYQRARLLRPVRGRSRLRGRLVTMLELGALVESLAAQGGPKAARDAALVLFLYATAARRREACRLRLEDLDLARGLAELRTKGGGHRSADLPSAVVALLERWLRARGRAPGPVFCPVDRFGNVTVRELSPGALHHICRSRARELGLERFAPHDLRRSHASALLDAGVDLHVVQELLGHEQLATTARYDVGRSKRRRAAIARLPMPFKGGRDGR